MAKSISEQKEPSTRFLEPIARCTMIQAKSCQMAYEKWPKWSKLARLVS